MILFVLFILILFAVVFRAPARADGHHGFLPRPPAASPQRHQVELLDFSQVSSQNPSSLYSHRCLPLLFHSALLRAGDGGADGGVVRQ